MIIQDAVAKGRWPSSAINLASKCGVVTVESSAKNSASGTHCQRTGDIACSDLWSRRASRLVCAVSKPRPVGALVHIRSWKRTFLELSDLLKVGRSELVATTRKVMTQLKDKESELEELRLKWPADQRSEATAKTVAGIQGIAADRWPGCERHAGAGRSVAGQVEEWCCGSSGRQRWQGLVTGRLTKDLITRLKAGDLIKEMAAEVGGTGGGGRPEMAQAGGKNPARLDGALEKVFGLVERMLQRYTDAG